jgi:hypothetical protein
LKSASHLKAKINNEGFSLAAFFCCKHFAEMLLAIGLSDDCLMD